MQKKVGKVSRVFSFFIEIIKSFMSLTNFLQTSIAFICFIIVSGNVFASESSIVLRMQDMNHKPISQAMCKAPFILQVELKNLDGYTDIHLMQYIAGIENFKTSRSMSSHNVSIDNGKKTTKVFYNFVLRSDKKGKFTVGHLTLKDKSGKVVQSNRLVIPVGSEVISSEEIQKDKYFMTMNIDKKQAYVGEKITLSIKFFDRLFVDDLHLQFPEFENAYFIKIKNHFSKSMVTFEGEEYSVTEWIFDVYAAEQGSLIFQDIHAVFFAPELESKFKLGGAFDFFRSLHKSEQHVVSNPVQVDIMPLPEHKDFQNIVAVGQFSNFTISINQNSVPVGQGVVLTTELFGSANFEMMKSPLLKLPNNFKYYDSNMVTLNDERSYKRCEFIVQASEPGNYRIEPQVFVYFDPIEAQYKTLQSDAINIEVTPVVQPPLSESNIEFDELSDDGKKSIKDFTVIKQGTVHEQLQVMIPSNKFQRLLWLLCFMWLFLIVYRYVLQRYVFKLPLWINLIVFYQARKLCRRAYFENKINNLYPIFVQLFTHLTGVKSGQLYKTVIVQYLIDKGFSDEKIKQWKDFYERILRVSFSLETQLDQQSLFQESLEWIKLLKEKS